MRLQASSVNGTLYKMEVVPKGIPKCVVVVVSVASVFQSRRRTKHIEVIGRFRVDYKAVQVVSQGLAKLLAVVGVVAKEGGIQHFGLHQIGRLVIVHDVVDSAEVRLVAFVVEGLEDKVGEIHFLTG